MGMRRVDHTDKRDFPVGAGVGGDSTAACTVHVCPDAPIDDGSIPARGNLSASTLSEARFVARRHRHESGCDAMEVVLCSDFPHVMRDTLVLTADDSNTLWRSDSVEPAIVSGTVEVSGWSRVAGKAGLMQAAIPPAAAAANASGMRHLWRQNSISSAPGVPAWTRLKRTTLEGIDSSCGTFDDYASGCMSFLLPSGEIMSLRFAGNGSGAPSFTTTSKFPLQWTGGVEFVFSRVGVPWIESRCAVRNTTIHANGVAIYLAEPCWSSFVKRGCASHAPFPCMHAHGNATVGGGAHPRRIENLMLSQPGRFATQDGSVYYTLEADETSAPVLTTAQPHALIEGFPGVSDITFANLVFELSARGPQPDSDSGHMETQTGYHACPMNSSDAVPGLALCPISAAVHFSAAKHVVFSGCTFRHMVRSVLATTSIVSNDALSLRSPLS